MGVARGCWAWLDAGVLINGVALRTIRERSGMSLSALAASAGIKHPHLSNIEAGRRNASPELAQALARALKVELLAILADPTSDEVKVS